MDELPHAPEGSRAKRKIPKTKKRRVSLTDTQHDEGDMPTPTHTSTCQSQHALVATPGSGKKKTSV